MRIATVLAAFTTVILISATGPPRAVRSAPNGAEGFASLLRVGQPIEAADRSLQQQGWRPAPGRRPDPVDRERAGNRLASLSACAGSGLGYCRYDYRRGRAALSVITVPDLPGARSGGTVLRWTDEVSGRDWGVCQRPGAAGLVPCAGR